MSDTNKRLIELLDANSLLTSDIFERTKETIQQVDNNTLEEFNTLLLTCLQYTSGKTFPDFTMQIEHIFLKIQNFACIIWIRFHRESQISQLEFDFLTNVGHLNRTIVTLFMNAYDAEHRRMMKCVIAPIIFKLEFLDTLDSIIKDINSNNSNHQHDSSILNVLSLWLDTISHTYYFLRLTKNNTNIQGQNRLTKIIATIIISPTYRQYVERHCNYHREMTLTGLFYMSSCSFYYAFDSCLRNWIDIIEPLLHLMRTFVIFHVQLPIQRWTLNIRNCIKCFISLITQYYEKIYDDFYIVDQSMNRKPPIDFDDDEGYTKSLTIILNSKYVLDHLLSTWSNEETIVIDMIITYFLRVIRCVESTKYELSHLLRTTDTVNTIFQLLLTDNLYVPLQKRIYSLVSLLLNDNIICKSEIAGKVAALYYTRIENSVTSFEKHEDRIEYDNITTCMNDFVNILRNDSIQKEILKLNKLNFFLWLDEELFPVQKYDIIWTLSFHGSVKSLIKNDRFLSSLRNRFQSTNSPYDPTQSYLQQFIWGILWNLGDHVGLAQLRKLYSKENPLIERVGNYIPITSFDVMINYCFSDSQQVDKLTMKLRGHGIRPLLNELSGASMSGPRNVIIDTKEAIENIKHFIICLSDNCVLSNFCKSILQYAHKRRLILIPIIVQSKYTIAQDWLYHILGSLSILSHDDTDIITKVQALIKVHEEGVITQHSNQSLLSHDDDDDVFEDNLHDLYSDCKNNEFDKIRNYINDLTIKQINKQQLDGSTSLHASAFYGHYEITQLLLARGAWRSIRNKHYLTAFDEARTEEIRQLFLRNNDTYYFIKDVNEDNVLEWTVIYDESQAQQISFRRQILGDTGVSSDYQGILDRFQRYYLETLSPQSKVKESLNLYFTMAKEENDLRYILSAYTSPTLFYRVLNKDLATYALHYFDSTLNQKQDYALSKCIIDLIRLLIDSNQLDKYYCQNTETSYRGMLMTRNDLRRYCVGSQIMNVSFLSTSEKKEIAQIYAGEGAMDSLRRTPDHTPLHYSVLCTYKTKNPRTALNIANLSEIPSEQEILILPFSSYEIMGIRKFKENENNGIMIEIELEECNETI